VSHSWIRCHQQPSITSLDALVEMQRNHALVWWVEPGRVLVAWPVGNLGWMRVEGKSLLQAVAEARADHGKPLEGVIGENGDPAVFLRSAARPTMLEILLRESIERARADPAGGGR
jgi:hypothetical protein